MTHNIEVYERTIVFVQRMRDGRIESFSKYADLTQILKDKIISSNDIDFNQIDYGNDQDPAMYKSISFPNLNIKIAGHIDRVIISMEDITETDKYFYEVSKNLSNILVREDISAIGINHNGVMTTKKADEIIKSKILDKCPDILKGADTASFKLVYKDENKKAIFIINIDSGAIKSSNSKEKEGILVSCNYHREIKTQQLMKTKMDEFQDSLESVKLKFEEYKKNIESHLNG